MDALNAIGTRSLVLCGAGGVGGEAARRPATRLDLDRNNSPPESVQPIELRFVPQYAGGRLDPVGGQGKRIEDLNRIKAVEAVMRCPSMLTLTIDRKRYASPQEAYEYAYPLVSKLLSERLGLRTWARVIEPQTMSGDGWVHWHVLIDATEARSMKVIAGTVWEFWRDRWGIGGCDLKRVRSAAGYLAKYITKAWPAIPPWMGESSKRFRLVGFSKRAGEIIRAAFDLPPRVPRKRDMPRRYRKTRTLYERLASSGLTTVVVSKCGDTSKYVGTLNTSVEDLITLSAKSALPGVVLHLERNKWDKLRMQMAVFDVRSGDEERIVNRIRRVLTRLGVEARTVQMMQQRYDTIQHSWAATLNATASLATPQ